MVVRVHCENIRSLLSGAVRRTENCERLLEKPQITDQGLTRTSFPYTLKNKEGLLVR